MTFSCMVINGRRLCEHGLGSCGKEEVARIEVIRGPVQNLVIVGKCTLLCYNSVGRKHEDRKGTGLHSSALQDPTKPQA